MSSRRFILAGTPAHAWERDAIDFVYAQLPDQDPFHARAHVEFRDPITGALHSLDLVALGATAIYVIELRDYPGRLDGDDLVWRWTAPDGKVRYLEHPLRALHIKARALAVRLEEVLRKRGNFHPGEHLPPVHPLVLLGGAEPTELHLPRESLAGVVQRTDIGAALRSHVFPGAIDDPARERITSVRSHAVRAGFDALELRPRRQPARIGSYEFGAALADDRGYQDREATDCEHPSVRRRARTYLVPDQTDQAVRLALRREADRDASLLWSVREHDNVLTLHEYLGDATLGPTLLLDAFEGSTSLRDFIARRPTLAFTDRIAILDQIALALTHCHRRVVYHGGLGPDAVLVRQFAPDQLPEVRIYNFRTGRSNEVSPTAHRSRFASEPAAAYQAPELFSAADALGPDSDLFSLGALAYHLFTGIDPAQSGIDLLQRIAREGALDPRSVTDTLPEVIADAIVNATRLSRGTRGSSSRGADVGAWIESIKAALSPPERPAGFASPLHAKEGQLIRDDLVVGDFLGQGASARVIEVTRDGQRLALKVSLGPNQDERLLSEARTLQRIHHPRIVQLHEALVLDDRRCLLLSIAGARTLQLAIEEQGGIDLDLALRYGDDLLSALEYLEAENIAHRDIKPANLGEGSLSKQSKRLLLFDFSLANADPSQIDVGTEPYRDPFLPLRGSWDKAADRWSAAIVLHEMLTGIRPFWKPRGSSPLASEVVLVIGSERFEAAVRDRLTAFFTTALARELPDRFASATAMRDAWKALGEASPTTTPSDAPQQPEEKLRQTLQQLAEDAPLEALPLSIRARNALDRAGLTRAVDLLALPGNRLSAIRGAGSKVAREIDDLRRIFLDLRTAPVASNFFPHYRGQDLKVDHAELPLTAVRALTDAGLDRLAAIAAAPEEHLRTLADRHQFDLALVRAVLEQQHDSVDALQRPSTSQAWIDALLPGATHVRRWLGLDAPVGASRLPTVREVASANGVSTAAVYQNLGRVRQHSLQHPALAELRALVTEALDDFGGVAPLWRAAEGLRTRLNEPGDDHEALIRAAALVRWTVELTTQPPAGEADGLRVLRLGDAEDATVWISRTHAHGEPLRELGKIADELAERDVLAAPTEAETALREVIRGTPLESLPQPRLLDLAAQASRRAVRSSRLELYRRQLPAQIAVLHTAPVLTGSLTPDEVEQRVRARYPEAAALPARPQLDELLAPLGLTWTDGHYRRHPDEARSSLHTVARVPPRRATAHSKQPAARTLEAAQSREFEARLELALRGREALLLAVTPRFADRAAAELSRVIQRPACLLDRRLIAAIEDLARTYEIAPHLIRDTDRDGPANPDWPNLCRLAAEAADRLADELFPHREPLLLARPGLLARFQLGTFVQRAVQATRERDAAALFFLVPCHRPHFIEDLLPVPGLAAAQRLSVPEPWLHNEGRRAATNHSHHP